MEMAVMFRGECNHQQRLPWERAQGQQRTGTLMEVTRASFAKVNVCEKTSGPANTGVNQRNFRRIACCFGACKSQRGVTPSQTMGAEGPASPPVAITPSLSSQPESFCRPSCSSLHSFSREIFFTQPQERNGRVCFSRH